MYFKRNEGVTLTVLTITVIVMLIISSTIIYVSESHISLHKVNNLYEDIDKLNGKIDEYYLDYGEIPVLSKPFCSKEKLADILTNNANAESASLSNSSNKDVIVNPNDSGDYYIIDLEKLNLSSLNYGYDDNFKEAKNDISSITSNTKNVYIINLVTHQIYYPSGIISNGLMYYTYNLNINEINI